LTDSTAKALVDNRFVTPSSIGSWYHNKIRQDIDFILVADSKGDALRINQNS